jgi:hypothetical protein
LASRLHATIVIEGDADALAVCRMRVNALLADEFDEELHERHTGGRLEYELRVSGGIPFPAFVTASQEFPELTVQVQWTEQAQGRSGRAVIQNGTLREQASHGGAAGGPLALDVRAAADGTLVLALACRRWRGAWVGYAIASEQHAFFRVEGDAGGFAILASDGVGDEWVERWRRTDDGTQYERLATPEAIPHEAQRELDAIAREFAREWIWFAESPPEEIAVERARFEAYGVPVAGANLRSEKLRKVLEPEAEGSSFSSFGDDTRWIARLMRDLWLAPGESDGPPTPL